MENKSSNVTHLLDTLSKYAWPAVAIYILVFLAPAFTNRLPELVKELRQAGVTELNAGDYFSLRIEEQDAEIKRIIKQQEVDLKDLAIFVRENSDRLSVREQQIDELLQDAGLITNPTISADFSIDSSKENEDFRVLWVDDNELSNAVPESMLIASGVDIDIATSTSNAITDLTTSGRDYNLIISDMGRTESIDDVCDKSWAIETENEAERKVENAGFCLLVRVRALDQNIPFIIYTSKGDDKIAEFMTTPGVKDIQNYEIKRGVKNLFDRVIQIRDQNV